MKNERPDVTIAGTGFYAITAQTRKGNNFMRRVQGNDHGTAYCDNIAYAQDIADGMVRAGLQVEVNGKAYHL